VTRAQLVEMRCVPSDPPGNCTHGQGAEEEAATYQDVIDSPRNKVAEIIGGELRLNKRPGTPALMAATTLVGELAPPFSRGRGGSGGWIELDLALLWSDVALPTRASERGADYEYADW
jgi:hypothetical protein